MCMRGIGEGGASNSPFWIIFVPSPATVAQISTQLGTASFSIRSSYIIYEHIKWAEITIKRNFFKYIKFHNHMNSSNETI